MLDTPLHSGSKVDHPSAGFHFLFERTRAGRHRRHDAHPYLKGADI